MHRVRVLAKQPCAHAVQRRSASTKPGPLAGIRVLEVGQFIAGPYASTLLGWYGAEVIKIEPLGAGDQIRQFRDVDSAGQSWWSYSINRNKRSVAMDLRKPEARVLVKKLATEWADVLLENFRPGQMDKWGLGSDELAALNPDLVYTSVTGYGRTGPYASRPGFASVCEAMGGFRYVNGFPAPNGGGGPERAVRPNLSMGDTLAGINGALGTILALYARDSGRLKGQRGQVVDASIVESVFGIMEGVLPDYSGAGIVRQPSGSTVTGIVPTNTYRCKDGKSVVVGANSDQLFKRLFTQMGRADMAADPRFAHNQGRVEHVALLDATIEAWTLTKTADEVVAEVTKAEVPNGLIYSIEDVVNDPHYQARGVLEPVAIPTLERPLLVPALGPKLSDTPGQTRWAGPRVGEHTREVLCGLLNLSEAEYNALLRANVVEASAA